MPGSSSATARKVIKVERPMGVIARLARKREVDTTSSRSSNRMEADPSWPIRRCFADWQMRPEMGELEACATWRSLAQRWFRKARSSHPVTRREDRYMSPCKGLSSCRVNASEESKLTLHGSRTAAGKSFLLSLKRWAVPLVLSIACLEVAWKLPSYLLPLSYLSLSPKPGSMLMI